MKLFKKSKLIVWENGIQKTCMSDMFPATDYVYTTNIFL